MAEHLISQEVAESDLLSCAAFLAESITSRDGHAEAMAAVVPRYLERGEVDLAAEFANTVEDPFFRDKLLTRVAEKCAELDDDEYAVQLAEAVEDPGLQSQAFESIALQKAAKGQIDKAFEIAENIAHPDYVQAGIAVRLNLDGKHQDADQMLEEIEYASARVSALQAMAGESFRGGNTEQAAELLDRAAASAGDIEHTEERIRTFIDIGNSFVEAKRNDKAIEAYDKARSAAEELDNVHRDPFLAGTALGFLHAGSLDLAERTLDLVADKTQIASALLGYAKEFWNKEQRDDALESIEESYQILKSQREIETRDSRARFRLFTQIAAQFAGFGKGERAIEIAHSIEDPDEQVQALTQVAAILAARNEDEQSRQAVNAIHEDSSRVFALISMSDSKAKNENREAAVSLLDEAVHLAETVPQLSLRSVAYNEATRRYFDLGEKDKAGDSAALSLRTIAAIRDESRRAACLVDLAVIQAATSFALAESDVPVLRTILRAS
jgi:tetratricopeptide (TPR) repeat protein